MKNTKCSIRLSLLILIPSLIASSAVQAEWIKSYGTKNYDIGSAITPSKTDYLLSMISRPSTKVTQASLLSLLNTNGDPVWTKKIATGNYDFFLLDELKNGRILLQGRTQATSTSPGNVVWAMYNVNRKSGALSPIFSKTYKGKGGDNLDFVEDDSGNLLVSGYATNASFSKGADMIVAKIDANTGLPVWSNVYDFDYYDFISTFIPKGNRYILLASTYSADFKIGKAVLGLLNNAGVPITGSFKTYGDGDFDTAIGIAPISGGNYLVYGKNKNPTNKNYTIFVMKLDSNLNYLWGKRYIPDLYQGASQGFIDVNTIKENADGSLTLTSNLIDKFPSVYPTFIRISSVGAVISSKSIDYQMKYFAQFFNNPDGSFLLGAGTTAVDPLGKSSDDILYGHFSADFVPNWTKTLGGSKSDTGFIEPQSGGYLMIGDTNTWSAGNYDVLVGKLDANGDVPGCPHINEVTVNEIPQNITAEDLNWQPQNAKLVKTGTITAKNIALTVTNAAIKVTNVCEY